MAVTIKYIGTQDRWPELSTTGKQSTWRIGQQEERSDSEAGLLYATGLFEKKQSPVTADAAGVMRSEGSPLPVNDLMSDYGFNRDRVLPTRNAVVSGSVQFRGATDTAASLGTVGVIINSDTNAAASTRFSTSSADYVSTINGASPAGKSVILGPFPTAVLRVHLAQLGLADPYVLKTSGTVDAATKDMLRLDFDPADAVKWIEVIESAPTNYAGSAGTGSARLITVNGLKQVA